MKTGASLIAAILVTGCAIIRGAPQDNANEGQWVHIGTSIIGTVKKYEFKNIPAETQKEWTVEKFPEGIYSIGLNYSEDACQHLFFDPWVSISIQAGDSAIPIIHESGNIGGHEYAAGPPGDEPYYSFPDRGPKERLIFTATKDEKYRIRFSWKERKHTEAQHCSITLKFFIYKSP